MRVLQPSALWPEDRQVPLRRLDRGKVRYWVSERAVRSAGGGFFKVYFLGKITFFPNSFLSFCIKSGENSIFFFQDKISYRLFEDFFLSIFKLSVPKELRFVLGCSRPQFKCFLRSGDWRLHMWEGLSRLELLRPSLLTRYVRCRLQQDLLLHHGEYREVQNFIIFFKGKYVYLQLRPEFRCLQVQARLFGGSVRTEMLQILLW